MLDKLQKLQFKKKTGPAETEQKNWYSDRYQSVVVQRNVLSIFSMVALIFSTIAIFLVYSNIPIVTVEPFVIQVEPKSGLTQVVNPQTSQEIAGDPAINQYFIARYIYARENVDASLPQNFQTVRLMSDPENVFRLYTWEVDATNPESFLARYGGKGERVTKITSQQRLDTNRNCVNVKCTAQVRVTIKEGQRGAPPSKVIYAIVTMEYTFTTVNLTVDERYVNPLGFRVLSYRVTQENL